jgi:ankyrin repeat protein
MTHDEAKAAIEASGINAAVKEDLSKVQPIVEANPALVEAMNSLTPKTAEETPQRLAARMRKIEIMEYFLSKGVKNDLFMATALGNVEFVTAHLAANPKDIDAKGAHGVQLMVHANHAPMVELLLSKGADPTLALQQLAWQGKIDLMKVAIDKGGKINMPELGRRPIHIASAMGHKAAVEMLLTLGADPYARSKGADWERKNAIALALMGNHQEVVAMLRLYEKVNPPPKVYPRAPGGPGAPGGGGGSRPGQRRFGAR